MVTHHLTRLFFAAFLFLAFKTIAQQKVVESQIVEMMGKCFYNKKYFTGTVIEKYPDGTLK